MPRYQFLCEVCEEEIEVIATFEDDLPERHFCGTPLLRVYGMPYIAAAATPSKRQRVTQAAKADSQLGDDRDAYRRMRRGGYQPRTIDGSAEMEQRAESQMELDMGKIIPEARRRKIQDGLDQAADIREQLGIVDA